MCAEHPSGDIFVSFRVEVAEPANAAYANKVKLSNLKEMAKTVAYIQEHGYNTRDSLEDSFSEIKSHASISRKELKSVEDNLRKVNEQIHIQGGCASVLKSYRH